MDKILSARVDEAVVRRIGMLAQRLGTTKKAVIETAITLYAEKIEAERDIDVLEQTFGTWQRNESPQETVSKGRRTFQRGMGRHHT